MPVDLGPRKIGRAVDAAFKRSRNFRRFRVMALREFTGQYYDADHGTVGARPFNMIYTAIRQLLPSMVFTFPRYAVESQFAAHRFYGELLAKALTWHGRQIQVENEYRLAIVDAFFTMGILKTGLATSDHVVSFDSYDDVDPGTVYTRHVDFDDFVFDPNARRIDEAVFVGDVSAVPRVELLESGLYDNELVERLPRADDDAAAGGRRDSSSSLSRRSTRGSETNWLDEVEVVELWFPRDNRIVTVPRDNVVFDRFLRETEYEGPAEGPFSYLALGPPPPNNPYPVAPVGLWHDLHVLGNRMVRKMMEQADRQKDVIGYTPAATEDAIELRDAGDGDMTQMRDPSSVRAFSFGGQNPANERFVPQLREWFQEVAGNPGAVGGQQFSTQTGTATEVSALAQGLNVVLDDMKDAVYKLAASEGSKRAWWMDTDPLINVPIPYRVPIQTPNGTMIQEVDLSLTPALRRGDFLSYTFTVEPESMGRVDSVTRHRRTQDFLGNVLPGVAQAAQVLVMLGQPVSIPRLIERAAKESDITWFDEVWFDPDFQQKLALMQQTGPQREGARVTGPKRQPNGQAATARARAPSPRREMLAGFQEGAADAQAALPVRAI